MAVTPGGQLPDLGQMRASAADRERAIDVLKAAFAEGRLDMDEYADRVGQVHASRTYGELAVLTADLPVGPLGTLPVAAPPALGAPGAVIPAMPALPAKVAVRRDKGNPNTLAVIAAVIGAIAIALPGWNGLGMLAVPAGFLALGNARGKFLAIAAIVLGLIAVLHG